MSQAYDVTIGMPVYRSKPYLRESLLSALAQSYDGIEVLVLDDGDDIGSMDVVRELQEIHPRGSHIRIVASPKNEGVGAARNHIIDETVTPFLYFMDSDDTIEPDTIALLMEQQRQYRAQMVFASIETLELRNGGMSVPHQYPHLVITQGDELPAYAYSHYGTFQSSVCNVLIDVAFLRQTGMRFTDAAYWEDLVFLNELLPHVERAVLLPRITYHYQFHLNSLSQFQDREVIDKSEVLKNVGCIERLKQFCKQLSHKPYAGFLSYALMMHDLYIVGHIVLKRRQLHPAFSCKEMQAVMKHPFGVSTILSLRRYRWRNVVLDSLSYMPSWLFLWVVWLFVKLKMKKKK